MNLCDLKVNLCGQKKLKGAELAAHTVNSPLNRLPSWHFYSNFQTCKRSSEISSNHCNVMYEGSPFERAAFSFIFSSSSRPGIMGSPSQVPQLTCVYTRGSGNLTRYHHSSYCSTKRRKPTLGMGITSPHTLFQRKNTNGIFHFKRTDFFVVKMDLV